jgi:hypothetical protein
MFIPMHNSLERSRQAARTELRNYSRRARDSSLARGVITIAETAVRRGRNHELPETDSRFSVQASASISTLYYNLRQPRGEVFILFINDQVSLAVGG